MSYAYLTRKETFSACHRLHSVELTDEENIEVYGKCNNPNGHGHNYTVEVTVCGPIDKKTGMVMNITEIKSIINEAVMHRLDHKNLDKDVTYFKNVPSTTENLVIFIWQSIKVLMKKPELLHEIKLYETDKNIVTYRGNRKTAHHITNGISSASRKKCDSFTNISSDSD